MLNFGIPGLNVEEVVDQFDRFASRWSPDLVLYLVVDNDLDRGICGGNAGLIAANGWRARIVHASRLVRLLYILSVRREIIEEGTRLASAPEAVDRFMRAMSHLASIANETHAQLGLAILSWPVRGELSGELSQGLTAAKIPILDVSTIACDSDNQIPKEGHLTPEGCRKVADAIARWLQTDGNLQAALLQVRAP